MSVLGTFIRDMRKRRGLSQRQIRGVSHAQISAIERGQRGVSPEMLRVLAQALQVTVEHLELLASFDEDHDVVARSIWVQKLEMLKAQGEWAVVMETAQRVLRTQSTQLGPALYARLEKMVAEAAVHQAQDTFTPAWAPFRTPEEGFKRHLEWYVAGMPPALSLQYVRYLRDTIDASHPIYGKILNNGMILCEQLGNIGEAISWGQKKSEWAIQHQDEPRYQETQALLLRYFIMTHDRRSKEQERRCQLLVGQHDNAYAWEDYYLAKMWQAWVENDAAQARLLDREAIRHYRTEWLDMPPWRQLYQTAWQWRQTQDPTMLAQWVENWLQWSWDRWDTQTVLHYWQIVVQAGLMTRHPRTPRWWQGLMMALRLARRSMWLEYYAAVRERLNLTRGWGVPVRSEKDAQSIPDWMQRMIDYWVDQVDVEWWHQQTVADYVRPRR